jgi:hypothetical protein
MLGLLEKVCRASLLGIVDYSPYWFSFTNFSKPIARHTNFGHLNSGSWLAGFFCTFSYPCFCAKPYSQLINFNKYNRCL